MRYLLTLDELLAMRTNGWSCECGAAWLDVTPGTSVKVASGDADHRHRKLTRAVLRPGPQPEEAPA